MFKWVCALIYSRTDLLAHRPISHDAQFMINLFCVVFSSGPFSFYCPPCVYALIFPFISPTDGTNHYCNTLFSPHNI